MNTFKTLLVGAALVLPAAAQAAECTLGENAKIVATPKAFVDATAAVQPTQIVEVMYAASAYSAVKAACSQEQVLAAFIRLNGPAAVGLDQSFKVPVLIAPAPAPQPTAAAPTVKPAESPEVKATQAELASTKSALATARAERDRLAAVSASRGGASGTMLTSSEKARYDAAATSVAALTTKVTDLERRMNAFSRFAEATNRWNSEQDGKITAAQNTANSALSTAKSANDRAVQANTKAEAAQKASKGWVYFIIIAMVLAVLALIVAFWARFRKVDVKTVVDEALKRDGLSHTTLLARINTVDSTLLARINTIDDKVDNIAQQSDFVDINFGNAQRLQLDVLPIGSTLMVDVIVDHEKKFEIRFKRIEDNFFVADEPQEKFRNHNPAIPIKDPLKFVRHNYGKGEFSGFLPVLELRQVA